jgi:His-Xaa-Ser system protein HxsD
VYSKNAIIKCIYWYSNGFSTNVELKDSNYNIELIPFNELTEAELEETKNKLKRDLLDYNLREIVKSETTTIRELIIAKAFSNGEFDEEPKGDLMDPLGIKFL